MRIYLIITLIFLSAHSIKANIYFVATNGNDANTGSEAQPWASIQKAANSLTAVHVVFLVQGNILPAGGFN